MNTESPTPSNWKPRTWSRLELSHAWLALAVTALFLSGFFALFISAAKMPGLSKFLTSIDFFRRALVVHVDLSVVVWFMSLPVALFHFLYQGSRVQKGMRFCYSAALAGVLLFALAGFFPDGRPLLSNYIPVSTHPLYLGGLLLFMFSIALNYFSAFSKPSNTVYQQLNVDHHLAQGLQWGVRLGSIYFLAGIFVLLYSTSGLPTNYRDEAFYEIGVWGFGHLQQFSNLIFMLVAWVLLLSSWSKKPLISKSILYLIFGMYVLPLLASLPLLAHDPVEFRYRQGFTELMRWGTFPPSCLFLVYLGVRIFKIRKTIDFLDYRFLIFICSAGLLLIGFVFGAFVRGPDLRLPGHYHATIGAVTLAFMGAVFILIDSISAKPNKGDDRLRRWSPLLYGLGQLGFSAGMFISGSYGMGRKMYGVEQQIHNFGQTLGLWVMGIGGILALVGGFVFAKASLPSILRLFRRQTHLRPS